MTPRPHLTELLAACNAGDRDAPQRLAEAIYPELRRLACHHLHHSPHEVSLQATELAHEAYFKLLGQNRIRWRNRAQLFAVLSRLLRRLLVDAARRRSRDKRGGGCKEVTLGDFGPSIGGPDVDVLALHQALDELQEVDEAAARVVEARFFAGLTHDEASAALGMGRASVGRRWRFARAWLEQRLRDASVKIPPQMSGQPESLQPGASPEAMAAENSGEVTRLLHGWCRGEAGASERLMPLVYGRLKEIASGMLSFERRDHTLQSTALVNEAYLRLVQIEQVSWSDRAHFFALSAGLMRRILVDHARRVKAEKREHEAVPLELADELDGRRPDLLALDRALKDLARKDPQQERIVELRFFGGLSREEIAEVLGIGAATVTRRWRMARVWLFKQLQADGGGS